MGLRIPAPLLRRTLAGLVAAVGNWLSAAEPMSSEWSLDVPAGGSTPMAVRFQAGDYAAIPGDDGQRFRMRGQVAPHEAGKPDLPTLVTVFQGRHDVVARLDVTSVDSVDIADVDVAAVARLVPPGQARPPAVADPAVYGVDAFWPAEVMEVSEAHGGDAKYVRVAVHPLQYNPVRRILRYHRDIEAAITYESTEAVGPDPAGGSKSPRDRQARLAKSLSPPPVDLGACGMQEGSWPLLPPMNGAPGDFAERRAGAEVDARYRIPISSNGLYRVTRAQLLSAGIAAADLVGSEIRLFCRDEEIAIDVSTDGVFGVNDEVVFYGVAHGGEYTETNVYWLGLGGPGRRMTRRSASIIGGGAEITNHLHSLVYNPDSLYRPFYRPTDGGLDHWFAALLTEVADATFNVTTDDPEPGREACISLIFHGLTDEAADPDHRTRVKIGGPTVITNFIYEGQQSFSSNCLFDSSLLNDGTTSVKLRQTQSGVTLDRVYLEEFRLHYWRALLALGDELVFYGVAGTNNYNVDGFSTNNGFWALDVSSNTSPVVLTNYTLDVTGNGHRLRFGDATSSKSKYAVYEEGMVVTVPTVEAVTFRGLADTNRNAKFILVCPYSMRTHGYELLKHRYLDGFAVAVAPLTDIYNEFSYGIVDAGAIKQFLGYAFHHWQGPPPEYVCLAGEGNYDPKDNLGFGEPNVIPVHLGPSAFSWTAMDGWFVTVNGADQLVDMAIGRIPVATDNDLGKVTDKVIAYDADTNAASWRTKATLVADDYDGANDFKAASENYIDGYLGSNGFSRSKAYLDDSSPGTIYNTINNTINGGRYLVTFFGHGGSFLWTDESYPAGVWNNDDVLALNNSVYPIVATFTCQNGAFHDPEQECMLEVFLERRDRGAIACFGPSALSVELYAEKIADGFVNELIENQGQRLGDAMRAGLLNLWTFNPNVGELLTYEIFGDPAVRVNSP